MFCFVDRSQVRWFRHLLTTPPGRLPVVVILSHWEEDKSGEDQKHAAGFKYPIWYGNALGSPCKHWIICWRDFWSKEVREDREGGRERESPQKQQRRAHKRKISEVNQQKEPQIKCLYKGLFHPTKEAHSTSYSVVHNSNWTLRSTCSAGVYI